MFLLLQHINGNIYVACSKTRIACGSTLSKVHKHPYYKVLYQPQTRKSNTTASIQSEELHTQCVVKNDVIWLAKTQCSPYFSAYNHDYAVTTSSVGSTKLILHRSLKLPPKVLQQSRYRKHSTKEHLPIIPLLNNNGCVMDGGKLIWKGKMAVARVVVKNISHTHKILAMNGPQQQQQLIYLRPGVAPNRKTNGPLNP